MPRAILAALLIGATLLPAGDASAELLWHGGAQRGLKAWFGLERVRHDRIRARHDAYRFELRDGERVHGPRGVERVEASSLRMPTGAERRLHAGETVYIGWRQRFARRFPSPRWSRGDPWCIFLQLHEIDPRTNAAMNAAPAVSMSCARGRQSLALDREHAWLRPWSERLVRGRWQSFVLGVTLRPHRQGTIELWRDGVKQGLRTRRGRRAPRTTTLRATTLGTDHTGTSAREAYLKMGVYRNARIRGRAVAHVADVRVATSFAEADPSSTGWTPFRFGAPFAARP